MLRFKQVSNERRRKTGHWPPWSLGHYSGKALRMAICYQATWQTRTCQRFRNGTALAFVQKMSNRDNEQEFKAMDQERILLSLIVDRGTLVNLTYTFDICRNQRPALHVLATQEQNLLSKSVPSTSTMRGQLWLPLPMPCMTSKPRNLWRHDLLCFVFRRLSIKKTSNFFANKWLIKSIGLVWPCFLLAPRWCPGFPQLSRAYLWSGRRLAQMKVWTVCRQICDSQNACVTDCELTVLLRR